MLLGHQTLVDQYSISNYLSAMLSCLINDISVKFVSSKHPSASELGSLGAGNCRRRSKTGGAVSTFADAGFLRELGRTSQQLCQQCEGVFNYSKNLRKHPEQRAGRWRAAKFPLRAEVLWNADTDGDGKINALDPDSDNDGLIDCFKQRIS